MYKAKGKQYLSVLWCLLFILMAIQASGGNVPPASLIISLGVNTLAMRPLKDSVVNDFRMDSPGFYAKLSGENYSSARRFIHVDLSMSFNKGLIGNGSVKVSRLCFNYGFGRAYEGIKLMLSPGVCYTAVGYLNHAMNKSVTESRLAPSLALQLDLILFKTRNKYLALFIEGSATIARPSRWVQQLAVGISWKPSFRKKQPDVQMPE